MLAVLLRAALIAGTILAAAPAGAHGLSAASIEGGVGAEFRYDDGTPVAFSEVKVLAPGESHVYQEGFTDREGRFLFRPSTQGVWRVRVDDGLGHAFEFLVNADSIGASPLPDLTIMPRPMALAVGLCAIFGIFGLWQLLARRRSG